MSDEHRPQWFPIPTGGDGDGGSSCIRSGPLYVSNETTSLPTENLLVLVDRLPPQTHQPPHRPRLARDLDVALAQEEEHRYYESFYGPRRDCHCFVDMATALPPPLRQLHDRFVALTGGTLTAREIVVEEYVPQVAKTVIDKTVIDKTVDGEAVSISIPIQQDYSVVYTFPIHPGKEYTAAEIDDSFVAEIIVRVPENNVPENNIPENNVPENNVPEIHQQANVDNDNNNKNNKKPRYYDLFQAWNKPPEGQLMAWNLDAVNDWADVRFPLADDDNDDIDDIDDDEPTITCIVRRGAMLKEWRSTRIMARPLTTFPSYKHEIPPPRIRVVRFLRLPPTDRPFRHRSDAHFGHVPTADDEVRRHARSLEAVMPPLPDLLTIVITTSPIPSNPNTALLENAMATFVHAGDDFAYRCRKVIICDGVREQSAAVTKKHATTKQAMRNGIVTGDQADDYAQYKANIRRLVDEAGPASPFANTTVVELPERHGFGYALRHAIRHCVHTPYVCVVQHDRTFIRNTPVAATVRAMWRHANIKYVGFIMKSNLTYRDTFQSKYGNGRHHRNEFDSMILRVPELCLSSADYGPGSRSIQSMKEQLRQKTQAWTKSYMDSAHGRHFRQTAQNGNDDEDDDDDDTDAHDDDDDNDGGGARARGSRSGSDEKKCQLSLIPTLFWFDNTHICETSHYRDFIFNATYRQVARGGFVEDKVSPLLKKTCERLGLREGHGRYGCYLLDDVSGAAFTGHIDGGTFMPHLHQNRLGV